MWHKECFSVVDGDADRGPTKARGPHGAHGMKHLINARIVLPAVYLLVGTLLIAV
jgi:hypothetical protein